MDLEGATYGFVNMMSDAPSTQRVVLVLKKERIGRIPHVTGSSSLFMGFKT